MSRIRPIASATCILSNLHSPTSQALFTLAGHAAKYLASSATARSGTAMSSSKFKKNKSIKSCTEYTEILVLCESFLIQASLHRATSALQHVLTCRNMLKCCNDFKNKHDNCCSIHGQNIHFIRCASESLTKACVARCKYVYSLKTENLSCSC